METENKADEYGIYLLLNSYSEFGYFEGFKKDVMEYGRQLGASSCRKITVHRLYPDSSEMRNAVLQKNKELNEELRRNTLILESHDFSSVRSREQTDRINQLTRPWVKS